jgi:hypothetical protein
VQATLLEPTTELLLRLDADMLAAAHLALVPFHDAS